MFHLLLFHNSNSLGLRRNIFEHTVLSFSGTTPFDVFSVGHNSANLELDAYSTAAVIASFIHSFIHRVP